MESVGQGHIEDVAGTQSSNNLNETRFSLSLEASQEKPALRVMQPGPALDHHRTVAKVTSFSPMAKLHPNR